MDEGLGEEPVSPLSALLGVTRNMFPDNIALAAVNMNILGIITFSLMFGLALASMGDAGESLVAAVDVSLSLPSDTLPTLTPQCLKHCINTFMSTPVFHTHLCHPPPILTASSLSSCTVESRHSYKIETSH